MICISDFSEVNKVGYYTYYIYSTWMRLQEKNLKMIEGVEDRFPIKFYGVDYDIHKRHIYNHMKKFNIVSLPTYVFYHDNDFIANFSGFVLTKPFTHFFRKNIEEHSAKLLALKYL